MSLTDRARQKRLLLSVIVFALVGCGDAQQPDSDDLILYGGMEQPGAWRLGNAAIEDGVLRLGVENEADIAVASQRLPPLAARGTLLLSIRAKAHGATDDLNVDLYGFGWDSPLQQLVITPAELTDQFRRYATLIRSGSSDMGIRVRLFTSSTKPILVDEVVLRPIVFLPIVDGGSLCDTSDTVLQKTKRPHQ